MNINSCADGLRYLNALYLFCVIVTILQWVIFVNLFVWSNKKMEFWKKNIFISLLC